MKRFLQAAPWQSPAPDTSCGAGWISRGAALLTLALAIAPTTTWACPFHDVTKTKTVKNTTGGSVGGVRFHCFLSPVPNCNTVAPDVYPGGFTSSSGPITTTVDFTYLGTLANNATGTFGFSYYNGGSGNIFIGSWWFTDATGNVQIGPTHYQIILFHGQFLDIAVLKNAGPAPLNNKQIKFVSRKTPLDPKDVAPTPALLGTLSPLADSILINPGDSVIVNLPTKPPVGGSSIVHAAVHEAGATYDPIDLVQTINTAPLPGLSPVGVGGLALLVAAAGVWAVRRRRKFESV